MLIQGAGDLALERAGGSTEASRRHTVPLRRAELRGDVIYCYCATRRGHPVDISQGKSSSDWGLHIITEWVGDSPRAY
jgi:hypothetical protein